MSDCEHTCYRCWLTEKKDALKSWVFHHMPLHWRHRRVMRAAMKMRHHWQTAGPYRFLVDPRSAHQRRLLLRSLTLSMEMARAPRRVAWKEDNDRP